MVAKYVRVSNITQNEGRQLDKESKLFIEKISGKISFFDRPVARQLISEINNGEIKEITFHAVERIGRNSLDSLKVIDFMEKKKIQVNISNLGLSLFLDNGKKNPMFGVAIAVLSSLAQTEKENMEERQREGIEIAKIRGVYKGRKAGAIQTEEQLLSRHSDIIKHLKINKNSLREISMMTGKSVNTIQKVKKIFKEKAMV
ncbi:MAG: recombinase family protein [Clostridia bacterium]